MTIEDMVKTFETADWYPDISMEFDGIELFRSAIDGVPDELMDLEVTCWSMPGSDIVAEVERCGETTFGSFVYTFEYRYNKFLEEVYPYDFRSEVCSAYDYGFTVDGVIMMEALRYYEEDGGRELILCYALNDLISLIEEDMYDEAEELIDIIESDFDVGDDGIIRAYGNVFYPDYGDDGNVIGYAMKGDL